MVELDQDNQINVIEGREKFFLQNGMSPEKWLSDWYSDGIPKTAENFRIMYRAKLLENT